MVLARAEGLLHRRTTGGSLDVPESNLIRDGMPGKAQGCFSGGKLLNSIVP